MVVLDAMNGNTVDHDDEEGSAIMMGSGKMGDGRVD